MANRLTQADKENITDPTLRKGLGLTKLKKKKKKKTPTFSTGLAYLRGERSIKNNKKEDKRMVSIEKLLAQIRGKE